MNKHKTDLRVRIDVILEWLTPPENAVDVVLREQANVKLGAIAHHFEKPLKELIEAAYLRSGENNGTS